MRFVGFIGPSYESRSLNVDCQRCINLYPEIDKLGTGKAREIAALFGTPGLSLLVNTGSGVGRGGKYTSDGKLIVVCGNKVYSISSSWVATELGTINSTSGPVSMDDNGTHLVIVDGTDDGWVVTLSSLAFAQITDPDFLGADQVAFIDGYFIFNERDSGQFYISGLNDTTFDALEIASSEGSPDNIVAILADHRDLWVFNERTIEVFFNSGNADFPFERNQGAFVEHGCAAPFSVAKMDNTVFWIGKDDKGQGCVYMAKGFQPIKISTHAVDTAIQGYGDISDAVAFTYQQDGHSFYQLNFTDARTSWVYDTSTDLWHERVYNDNGTFDRHRAQFHVFAFNKHVVGDYANGKLYELSMTTYSDNGTEIIRERIAPHIYEDDAKMFYSKFKLDMETGVGLDGSGQGTDPKVMLQFSDDGGHTWSNEKWADIGQIGNRKARAIWRRLGSARDRVFKIRITDPVKVVLIGADIDVEKGAA